jgi:formate hydrogenlyase transcriptional activator
VPLTDLAAIPSGESPTPHPSTSHQTLKDSERELIRRTLDKCGWVVGGPQGAAARLGLNRTTLLSRMKKLGLTRPAGLGVE